MSCASPSAERLSVRLVPAAGPGSPEDRHPLPDTWCRHLRSGGQPFLLPCFSGVLLLTSLAPLTRRDAPKFRFSCFLGASVVWGANWRCLSLGPRPPCRSRRRSWSRTRAAASNAGWVGPLTPSLFGKGLAQTLCTDGYRVHDSSRRAESWQSEPGGRKWHLAGIYHVFFFFFVLLFLKIKPASFLEKKKKQNLRLVTSFLCGLRSCLSWFPC